MRPQHGYGLRKNAALWLRVLAESVGVSPRVSFKVAKIDIFIKNITMQMGAMLASTWVAQEKPELGELSLDLFRTKSTLKIKQP